jgi:hypothetical protein
LLLAGVLAAAVLLIVALLIAATNRHVDRRIAAADQLARDRARRRSGVMPAGDDGRSWPG